MAKYVIYIPGIDALMMDGKEPYINDEKEVRRVIAEETVHPKHYEAKPVSFLKAWAKKQEQKEAEVKARPHRFSPTSPEFHYIRPEGQKRYLLIVGDENQSKSGTLVKDFDTREEAATLADRSIAGLIKEFPNLGYFIFDAQTYGYTDAIKLGERWRIEDFGHGDCDREGNGGNPREEPSPTRKRRKAAAAAVQG